MPKKNDDVCEVISTSIVNEETRESTANTNEAIYKQLDKLLDEMSQIRQEIAIIKKMQAEKEQKQK